MRRKARQRLTADRRSALIERVATIMATGEPTLFAFEADCRHGIRAALCLEHWPWLKADAAAADVVAVALQRLGAVRPSWEQGQRTWEPELTERRRCANCGMPMPPAPWGCRHNVPRKFCSARCCQVGARVKARWSGERVSRARYLEACAARADRTRRDRAKPCRCCGAVFSPIRREQHYCCQRCVAIGTARRMREERVCRRCGAAFESKPSSPKQFCSHDCYASSLRVAVKGVERTCPVCRARFRVHCEAKAQRCCSRQCASIARWGGGLNVAGTLNTVHAPSMRHGTCGNAW